MPDYLTIYTLKPNLYTEGCPLLVHSGTLRHDPETGILTAVISFLSITDREIASATADLHFFDEAGGELKVVRDYLYLAGDAIRDTAFGGELFVSAGNGGAKSFSIAVREVAFSDETFWTGSADPLSKAVPARKALKEEVGDLDAVRRFARDFSTGIAKNPKIPASFVPAAYKDLWLCACGGINQRHEEGCFRCGASYALQLDRLKSRSVPKANPPAPRRSSAAQSSAAPSATVQRDTAQAARKEAEAAAVKAKAQEFAAQERLRAKKALAPKKRRRIALVAGIALLLIVGLGLTLLFTQIIPQSSYSKAEALLREGRFNEAIAAFSALGDYGDSTGLLLEAKYQRAEELLDAKDYPAAIEQYTAIAEEREVAERITEAKYRQAGQLMVDENFTEALALYTEIDGYQDSVTKAQSCHFSLAKLETEANDTPSQALKLHLENLTPADSLSLQQLFLDKGSALYRSGKAQESSAYFSLITNAEIRKGVEQLYYDEAVSLIQKDELDAAAKLLERIPDYEDSEAQLLHIGYLKAEKLYAAGDYTGAAQAFSALGAYNDAADRASEASYQVGVQQLANGDYPGAAETFLSLGDYSDAAGLASEAAYQLGLQQLNNGNVVDSYNTLYAIRGYDPAFYLLVTNSQYYIEVYDPGLGPNPLDEQ